MDYWLGNNGLCLLNEMIAIMRLNPDSIIFQNNKLILILRHHLFDSRTHSVERFLLDFENQQENTEVLNF